MPAPVVPVHCRGRLRACRAHDPATLVAARMETLKPFVGATPEARRTVLSRLLREERRAALTGAGYDAVRHAALRRLLRDMA